MSLLQQRSRSWIYVRAWPLSPETEPHGLEMRRIIQAWSAVSKGSAFPRAVVLGWGRGIFHHLGLLQVPLVLPNAFAWGKAAAPACPAGRPGTFPSSSSCWTRQGCAASPCALLPGSIPRRVSTFCPSAGYEAALPASAPQSREISPQSPLIPCPAAGGVCTEGGWGLGVGCTFNSSLS